LKLTFLFFVLFNSFSLYASDDQKIKETLSIIENLIHKKKPSKDIKFNISKCDIQKQKWLMLLLTKQSFKESIKFKKNCDIEGSFSPKMEVPFTVDLKLRNAKAYNQTSYKMKINLSYDPTPMITLSMNSGVLKSKVDTIEFSANYSAEIDPLSKEIIKKDNGGTLKIISINGKKINKSFPLKAK